MEILQARILEWVARPSFRGSSPPRDRTHVSYLPCIGRRILYHWVRWGSRPREKPRELRLELECQGAANLKIITWRPCTRNPCSWALWAEGTLLLRAEDFPGFSLAGSQLQPSLSAGDVTFSLTKPGGLEMGDCSKERGWSSESAVCPLGHGWEGWESMVMEPFLLFYGAVHRGPEGVPDTPCAAWKPILRVRLHHLACSIKRETLWQVGEN